MHRILGRFERIPVSKPFCPCLFRTVQQRNEIDIVPNRQSCQRDDVRECEFALCLVLHYSQEEIGNHGHPYLDFNGVDVVAKEVFKRKILLQFLEKALSLLCIHVLQQRQIWDGDHVYDSVLPVSRDVSRVC